MVEVEIRGKKFPLCLTVAAVDKVNEKCGGLGNLNAFLKGDGNPSQALCNMMWLMGVMLQEGEENRLIESRFAGEKTSRREVPGPDAIMHLLTPGAAQMYRMAVWQAVGESMHQEIEVDPSKNVESAERA